ncbi:MAG TPA: MFS transporter [Candidatus Dormibacteraeota bacterium]|jgi:fucose permease
MAAIFLLMGIVVGGYGPLLVHLTRRFGVSLPVAGSIISVHFAGSLPGVLIAMQTFARFRARSTVVAAVVVVGVGCAAAAVAFVWPFFLAAVLVIGFGFGALVLGLNQLVAHSEGRRRAALLNALNSCFSAGAVVGPIVVAAFAGEHFSTVFLVAAAVWFLLLAGTTGISGRLPIDAASPARPSVLVGIFTCAFVLYVAIETGTGGWMTTHLQSVGLTYNSAAALTSGFFLAIVTGRLLITLVPAAVPESTIVLAGAAVATVALLAASFGPGAPVAYIVAGLAMAPIFPTGIVWLARLRPGDSRATSWLFPAASIGGTLGPGAIGVVIAGAGVGWAPVVLSAVAAAMTAAFFIAARR